MARVRYKGKFSSYDDLPKADLPENSVMYEEVDSVEEIAKVGSLIGLIPFAVEIVLIIIKRSFSLVGIIDDLSFVLLVGSILYLLSLVPHELIHALCFPKDAEVEFYQALKKGALFVTGTSPMTKKQFIIMSLMPNIIFSVIPVLIYMIVDISTFTRVLVIFSLYSALSSGGDLYNVYNTTRQVPKGAHVVMSGIHTYWYC